MVSSAPDSLDRPTTSSVYLWRTDHDFTRIHLFPQEIRRQKHPLSKAQDRLSNQRLLGVVACISRGHVRPSPDLTQLKRSIDNHVQGSKSIQSAKSVCN